MFVRPTQAIEIFGNVSTPFGTMAICWHPGKILSLGHTVTIVAPTAHECATITRIP